MANVSTGIAKGFLITMMHSPRVMAFFGRQLAIVLVEKNDDPGWDS